MLREEPGLLASLKFPTTYTSRAAAGGLGVGGVERIRAGAGEGSRVLVGGLCPWGAGNKGNHATTYFLLGERPG